MLKKKKTREIVMIPVLRILQSSHLEEGLGFLTSLLLVYRMIDGYVQYA